MPETNGQPVPQVSVQPTPLAWRWGEVMATDQAGAQQRLHALIVDTPLGTLHFFLDLAACRALGQQATERGIGLSIADATDAAILRARKTEQ